MLGTINAENAAGNMARDFCVPDPHVLHRLAHLSAELKMLTNADIVAETGETFWRAGQPVSGALFESVRGQRLRVPLETCLVLSHPVSSESVVSDCLAFMQDNPVLLAIGRTRGALDVLLRLGNQALPQSFCLLLALSHSLQARRYEQQLTAMVVSAGLANALQLDEQDAGALVLASLACNTGELLLDPQITTAGRSPSAGEWPSYAQHPEIGAHYLQVVAGLPESVINAVRQHHQRQDGSGYPAQLTVSGLSLLGVLTGLADVVATILTRGEFSERYARVIAMSAVKGPDNAIVNPASGAWSPARGEANRCARALVASEFIDGEYPAAAAAALSRTLAPAVSAGYPSVSGKYADLVMPVLQQIRASRLAAGVLSSSVDDPRLASIGGFALSRLLLIDKRLRAFELYEFSRWHLLEQSPQLMGKACLLLDEATWRLRDLARLIQCRITQNADNGYTEQSSLIDRLVDLLDAEPPAA